MNLDFYRGKNVFLTGHTGFKGAWMCKVLLNAGANITGYALAPQNDTCLYKLLHLDKDVNSIIADIRDLERLEKELGRVQPEVVIHMAAQPIVRESYLSPVYTYDTNVMGTVNICEGIRKTPSVESFVNVTTDKVYLNKEWEWGYRENEELNGFDPYSNSKSCSELVTSCYRNCFFTDSVYQKSYGKTAPAVSTCRAGNVIGGGDFAPDRIIPDCIRAIMSGQSMIIRNPYSIRPYEHVLEPVMAYLMIAAEQYTNKSLSGCYNIGPDEKDCWETGRLVSYFCERWNMLERKQKLSWINGSEEGPHEARYLKLDCSKLKNTFNWRPTWDMKTAIDMIVEWTDAFLMHEDVGVVMDEQIKEYILDTNKRDI